jgi:hypothetical protein
MGTGVGRVGINPLIDSNYCPFNYPQVNILNEGIYGEIVADKIMIYYTPSRMQQGDEEKIRYRLCNIENGVIKDCSEGEITYVSSTN